MRVWGREKAHGKSLWWPVVARNKKAITLDLRQAEGQALLKDLVEQSDFLLENFRPGHDGEMGARLDRAVGDQSAPDHDPRVRLRPDGPVLARRPASARSARRWAACATSSATRRRRRRAWASRSATRWRPRSPASAPSSALHHRDKTGRGQVVDSAIYEAVLNMMESLITEYDKAGYIRERTGAILPNVAPSNVYPTSDGMVLIAANQDTVFAPAGRGDGAARPGDGPAVRRRTARAARTRPSSTRWSRRGRRR